MTDRETAWQAAESAASVLGPEADVLASVDSAGLGGPGRGAAAGRAEPRCHDVRGAAVLGQRGNRQPGRHGALAGGEAPPQVAVPEDDKRFADRTSTTTRRSSPSGRWYLAASQLVTEVLAAGSGDAMDDAKARLAAGFMLDAMAPTNFLLTNPAAIKRAMETGGASVAAGARDFVDDVLDDGGRPRQVDTRPFRVGVNLAATQGQTFAAAQPELRSVASPRACSSNTIARKLSRLSARVKAL